MRGFVVYFWVDRLRRKLAYWEVSINLVFSICLFLNSVFVFSVSLCYIVLLAAEGMIFKIKFLLPGFLFLAVIFSYGAQLFHYVYQRCL